MRYVRLNSNYPSDYITRKVGEIERIIFEHDPSIEKKNEKLEVQ